MGLYFKQKIKLISHFNIFVYLYDCPTLSFQNINFLTHPNGPSTFWGLINLRKRAARVELDKEY